MLNITSRQSRRFWDKVHKTDGCWEWTGPCRPYGRVCVGSVKNNTRREVLAHRASWTINFGQIPDGKNVCHSCDNPACVRPDHLFIGSQKENMQDMYSKGRQNKNQSRVGVFNGMSKLRNDEIYRIRLLSYLFSHVVLSRLFKVDAQTIGKIVSGQLWKHI